MRLLAWTAVCGIAAAPSFLWACAEYDLLGMCCGVACFVVAYTLVQGAGFVHELRQRPFVHSTLIAGYVTRVAVSAIYPLGLGIDLWPGLFSIMLIEGLLGPGRGFTETLATTLVQGTILNLLLACYMLLIYVAQKLLRKPPIPIGHCRVCGYDLRASPIRCPECGEPAPPTEVALASPGH